VYDLSLIGSTAYARARQARAQSLLIQLQIPPVPLLATVKLNPEVAHGLSLGEGRQLPHDTPRRLQSSRVRQNAGDGYVTIGFGMIFVQIVVQFASPPHWQMVHPHAGDHLSKQKAALTNSEPSGFATRLLRHKPLGRHKMCSDLGFISA
jgi:hypothetical protein